MRSAGIVTCALPSLGAVLAACSAADSGDPDDPDVAAPTETGGTGTGSSPEAETLTLTLAADDFVAEQFEPRLMNARSFVAYGFLLYDTVNWVDMEGNVIPGYAESYERSDDGLEWTFTLRPMQFHDGTEVTAHDVVFAFEQMLSDESNMTNRSVWVGLNTEAEVVDDRTFIIRTERPFAELLFATSPRTTTAESSVFPRAYYEEVGPEGFREAPIGTGPWRFVSRTPGERLEFAAVKDHPWRPPSFDELVLRLMPEESTKVASLLTGEVDAALVSFDSIPQLESAGLQIVSVPDVRQASMSFFGVFDPRIEGMPTGDVRVREALAKAINVEEMIDTIWAGRATQAEGDVERLSAIYGEWERPAIPYEPETSAELLSEAGYPNGFDLRVFSTSSPFSPWGPDMVEAVAGYWEAIGVNVEILPTDSGTLSEMTSQPELDPEIIGAATNIASTRFPASIILPRNLRTDTGFRTMRDEEVNDLMAQGIAATSEEERDRLIRQAAARWYDLYVTLVLAFIPLTLALGPRIEGIDLPNFGADPVSAFPDRMVPAG